jgi:RNA polymerase sigma-70 factor (ECF subfamily)
MMRMPADEQVTQAWREHHAYVVDLAYRMLGDIGEAEDAVQEAFSRLLRTKRDDVVDIEDERGWLIVVTSRLCLDQIRSARSRREHPRDVGLLEPEPAVRAGVFADPADRVTLDDSLRLALLVVLERLTPPERVVFVLHDIFQMPFDAVAETVGRSAPACRQLARRARLKIDAAQGGGGVGAATSEQRAVTEKFIAACSIGDIEGLLEVLDPNVSGDSDVAAGGSFVGAELVARNLLRYVGARATLVSHGTGDESVLLIFINRRLVGLLLVTVGDGRITKLHSITEPAKIAFLRTQLAAAT